MAESSPANSPSQSRRQSGDNDYLVSPVTPVSPSTTHSILSHLLKKDSREREPLIKRHKSKDYNSTTNNSSATLTDPELGSDQEPTHPLDNQRKGPKEFCQIKNKLSDPQSWITCFTQPIGYIPAVILGLLLNLLDAISYGMITFPLNNPIFASFGPEGISMFFVSCIISQIVYSCGGSAFKGGNGSMMIEVVPFLHIIAEKIVSVAGQDNPTVVIPSTLVAFALSSIMTGLAFFLLGALKLGSLIGFFPRHILVGTIGGVGWFLVATGIEVSGRLESSIEYTIPMFRKVFMDFHVLSLWSSALAVAILLRIIQHRIASPMVVPVFFMVLPIAFYIFVFIFGLDVQAVRDAGWIFPLVENNTPFWHFYTYYNFKLVDWKAVAETIPAMLALTFFGVLHVPINVPALGVSTNKDDVDVNRELVAHGISNAVSGLFGSVQNYLVYTNSLLFIRSGGDSRVAGLMLAGATAILWMVGPWIVGYIPVMVVGSLIFHLGLDLLKEALVDTWNSVHYLEYITICAIIACMAALGFVEGILVGIIMACVFFVVQNARRSEAIRATYTGQYMRSTVRRLYRQEKFLKEVGGQIQVVKLQGYLFFGTIDQVERAIREMLDEHEWDKHPIRFLILDLQLVQGLDFSAAEAFVRIRRLLRARQVYMIVCNVARKSDEEKALMKAGIWVDHAQQHDEGDLKCFEYINDALEWCENVLLTTFFEKKPNHLQVLSGTPAASVPITNKPYSFSDRLASAGSPRHHMVTNAIHHVFSEAHSPIVHSNTTQPTLILVQAFGEIGQGNVQIEFFHKLSKYFERTTCDKDHTIYREGDPCEYLLVLEQGSLRSLMHVLKEQVTVETILPGTVVGEMGMFIGSRIRTRSLLAEQDSVYWKLTRESFDRMCKDDAEMANQFILLTLYFSSERLDTMTRYAFHLH
ncbi:sulfate transporter family-domain-containing protein [Mucor mucedo]|uniref:sulfate transporter family-domain-containing protein n=1 Tax=Mucor mucedo TaxID=29922 RepID=UPI002220BFF2|nr:sulfate transporter family-domain-containing protein [Mucor mucedo]KAI7894467.1 sulfate transporter family-domain-containing protein [Mucor mucedo]